MIDIQANLSTWLTSHVTDADRVAVEGLDRMTFGHSAEMLVLTVVSERGGLQARQDVVLRGRPPAPALLEPYDLTRQFTILRALEGTAVRVPKVLWFEPTGDVLGREFLIMEYVQGTVYEMDIPAESDETVRQMCRDLVEQIAAVHAVDLAATGLANLDDGAEHLDRELGRWAGEMHRVQRGPLPALERLLAELRGAKPPQCPRITLVHGDAKPGNFAFADGRVSAVFDWEMATVGDPLTDIGWLELLWAQPVGITSHVAALPIEELLAHYEQVSGITLENRSWYRAFNAFKMAVICLIGARLIDDGHSEDPKLGLAAYGTSLLTATGLGEFGITESIDDGPVMPDEQRLHQVLNGG